MAPVATNSATEIMLLAAEAGVDICFANPGTSEMHMVAALDGTPSIRPVLGLHEGVCTGAADGYGRVTGKPAMVMLHLGPGLSNGLSNLHNARRARTPLLCVLGDMSSWIKPFDPPLSQDIAALAGTVGHVTLAQVGAKVPHGGGSGGGAPSPPPGGIGGGEETASAAAAAAEASVPAAASVETADSHPLPPRAAFRRALRLTRSRRADPYGSRVSTLVIDHDVAYAAPPSENEDPRWGADGPSLPPGAPGPAAGERSSGGVGEFASEVAGALRSARESGRKAAILVGNSAASDRHGGTYSRLARVAAASGARLLLETFPPFVERGAGFPAPAKVPYFPDDAARELSKYGVVVLVDAKRPVAMFGYDGGPASLLTQSEEDVWEVDGDSEDVREFAEALEALTPGARGVVPGKNCGGAFAPPGGPGPALPPDGGARLTPQTLCAVVAALQPAGCVLVDEAITTGGPYYEASARCPPFRQLSLTGGAIGSGPPLALGAALADPSVRVVDFQADGSGAYTLQALWTQAKEHAKVLTVICSNSIYSILKLEIAKQGCSAPAPDGSGRKAKPTASRRLTELSDPPLDWVALAAGFGVPGARAETVEECARAISHGLTVDGPFLVQAVLNSRAAGTIA